MPPTVPKKSDIALLRFVDNLLSQPIRPAKGLTSQTYEFDRQLQDVPLLSNSPYPSNYCWFNCLEHCLSNSGGVVFGWGIWQQGPKHFVAQHHAVWRSPSGDFLDPTPNTISNTTLFIPDSRAPFDYEGLRCPFNFESTSIGENIWFASSGVQNPFFSIAALQPPTMTEALRINDLVKLAKSKGFKP